MIQQDPEINIPVFDELGSFAEWYQRQYFAIPLCPADGVRRVGGFSGLTLYRQGPFQVQLWICEPNSVIPDHCHPNVDSIQMYLSGEVFLRLNGEEIVQPNDVHEAHNGLSSRHGFFIRICPGDIHGATIGPKGGSFLTFQRFLDGKPKSVELDWAGEPIDKAHEEMLMREAA